MYQRRQQTQQDLAPDSPLFHLQPNVGWINDPNGPLYDPNTKTYHIFYQYLPNSVKWEFGIVWGHAVSKDLVHWSHLPPALEPTPGGLDQDGCFSGCATVDEQGHPVLLYTGVRLRGNPDCGPLPPAEHDLQLPFIESQIIAYADRNDWKLTTWQKDDVAFMLLPPGGAELAGWRDPYILHRPGQDGHDQWTMLMGCGYKNKGGCVLVYKSQQLTHGWECVGELCSGTFEDGTGYMWECPLLCKLSAPPVDQHWGHASSSPLVQQPFANHLSPSQSSPLPKASSAGSGAQAITQDSLASQQAVQSSDDPSPSTRHLSANNADAQPSSSNHHQLNTQPSAYTSSEALSSTTGSSQLNSSDHPKHSFFFCISPDACTNPTLYYLGNYKDGKFDIANALGPFKLDLGNILYAPNTLVDEEKGRILLWGWLQEHRKVGTYTYAGCLSVPRELWVDTAPGGQGCLMQRPLPELVKIRKPDLSWVYTSQALGSRGLDAAAAAGGAAGDDGAAYSTSGSDFKSGSAAAHLLHGYLHDISGTAPCRPAAECVDMEPDDISTASVQGSYDGDLPDTLLVGPGQSFSVPQVTGSFLELKVVLARADAPKLGEDRTPEAATNGPSASASPSLLDSQCSGVLLRSWQSGQDGSAVLLYHWDSGVLELVFEALDPVTHTFSLAAPDVRRVGGRLQRPPAAGQPLVLHLFLDYSVLEVFTGAGEVLSTRVYRGSGALGEGAGVEVVSLACTTQVLHLEAHEVGGIGAPPEMLAALAASDSSEASTRVLEQQESVSEVAGDAESAAQMLQQLMQQMRLSSLMTQEHLRESTSPVLAGPVA